MYLMYLLSCRWRKIVFIDLSLTLFQQTYKTQRQQSTMNICARFLIVSTGMDETELKKKTFGVFNPNQRQFFEDELRYRQKLEQLHAGLMDNCEKK